MKNKSGRGRAVSGGAPEPVDTDDEDMRIVNVLLQNARLSYRQIAARLGLSTATVAQRLRKLERQRVFLGTAPILDYEKLGYAFCVLTQVKVKQGKLFDVMKRIAEVPHVFAVYDHTGGNDVTVLARFRERHFLDHFLKFLQSIPQVERTVTQLVLNVYKENIRRLPDLP